MNFFNDYFVFSTSEKKGIFIFICILFLMTLFYMVMPYIFTSENYDFTAFKKELEAKERLADSKTEATELFAFNPNRISKDSLLLLGLSNKQSYNIINFRNKIGDFKSEKDFRKIYSIPDSLADELAPYLVFDETNKIAKDKASVRKTKDSLFNFDPNTVDYSQLQSLGFSEKQAQTLLNFKNKGGRFYKKEDLKKIYSISDELYTKLEPHISITKQEEIKSEIVINKIELNGASKEQLKSIRGIGEKTAERIVKYRKQLGGFKSLSQLNDVYGLDSTIKMNKVIYFSLDEGKLSQININLVTFKELLSHPYCDYNSTKKIINYREMHGDFNSLEQIVENNLIKAEQYRKIAPYLTLK